MLAFSCEQDQEGGSPRAEFFRSFGIADFPSSRPADSRNSVAPLPTLLPRLASHTGESQFEVDKVQGNDLFFYSTRDPGCSPPILTPVECDHARGSLDDDPPTPRGSSAGLGSSLAIFKPVTRNRVHGAFDDDDLTPRGHHGSVEFFPAIFTQGLSDHAHSVHGTDASTLHGDVDVCDSLAAKKVHGLDGDFFLPHGKADGTDSLAAGEIRGLDADDVILPHGNVSAADSAAAEASLVMPGSDQRVRSLTCEFRNGMYKVLRQDGPCIGYNAQPIDSESEELESLDGNALLEGLPSSSPSIFTPGLCDHAHSALDNDVPMPSGNADASDTLASEALPAMPASDLRMHSLTCEFREGMFRVLKHGGPWTAYDARPIESESEELGSLEGLPGFSSASFTPGLRDDARGVFGDVLLPRGTADAFDRMAAKEMHGPDGEDFLPHSNADAVEGSAAEVFSARPGSNHRMRSLTCEFRNGTYKVLRKDGPWIGYDAQPIDSESEELESLDGNALLEGLPSSSPSIFTPGLCDHAHSALDNDVPMPSGNADASDTLAAEATPTMPASDLRMQSLTCEFRERMFRVLKHGGPWTAYDARPIDSESEELRSLEGLPGFSSASFTPGLRDDARGVFGDVLLPRGNAHASGRTAAKEMHGPDGEDLLPHSDADAVDGSAAEVFSARPGSDERMRSLTCEFREGMFRALRQDGPWIPYDARPIDSESEELESLDDKTLTSLGVEDEEWEVDSVGSVATGCPSPRPGMGGIDISN